MATGIEGTDGTKTLRNSSKVGDTIRRYKQQVNEGCQSWWRTSV